MGALFYFINWKYYIEYRRKIDEGLKISWNEYSKKLAEDMKNMKLTVTPLSLFLLSDLFEFILLEYIF
jgi:hypothetical protein